VSIESQTTVIVRATRLWLWAAALVGIGLLAVALGRLELFGHRSAVSSAALTPGLSGAVRRVAFPAHPWLYSKDDAWQSYLADEATCPGGERTDLPLDQQARVMECLINGARARSGLRPLPSVGLLGQTALLKANEIVACRNFDHAACGGQPDADVRATGYRGAFGENLYIAGGRLGAPRIALDGWLNSPGHRRNLFRSQWRTQGIAVLKLDRFGAYRKMTLWVSHFGSA
jgi:uncharacterized protein YkwD